MIPQAAAILAAMLAAPAPQDTLPADPFQRVAVKIAQGHIHAHGWQRDAYARGLAAGVTADRRFLLTSYYGTEPDGRVDRYGRTCTLRTAASNRLPRRAYIWTRYGLRQVLDCGARSNDRRADRAGCDAWCDYWMPTARQARKAGLDGWTPAQGAVIPNDLH